MIQRPSEGAQRGILSAANRSLTPRPAQAPSRAAASPQITSAIHAERTRRDVSSYAAFVDSALISRAVDRIDARATRRRYTDLR